MPNCVSPSFLFPDVYPRLVFDFTREEGACGGVNVAIEPLLPPPATSTRFFAFTVSAELSFLMPPNRTVRDHRRDRAPRHGGASGRCENPFKPPSYL